MQAPKRRRSARSDAPSPLIRLPQSLWLTAHLLARLPSTTPFPRYALVALCCGLLKADHPSLKGLPLARSASKTLLAEGGGAGAAAAGDAAAAAPAAAAAAAAAPAAAAEGKAKKGGKDKGKGKK